MKILMINHFPLAGSGSGTYTKNLAVHLAEMGHEVAVLLPENTEDFEEVSWVRLIPVYFTPEDGSAAPEGALPFNFPCFTTHPRSTQTFGDLSEEQLSAYISAFRAALKKEIDEWQPDLIHGQHVWILSSLAADFDVPLVLTAHGTDLVGYDAWPKFRSYAEKAMTACRKVISISRDNMKLLEERFPEDAGKIIMMRNGYDPKVFLPMALSREEVLSPYGLPKEDYEGKRIVVYAGKLTYIKGVDVLLKAVQEYEEAHPAVLTLIVGDGEEWDNLHALAEELGLSSLRFLGNVDQQELCRLYNIADLSVTPSRKEAFGLVALEAMACGIPVVATRQGGLPDFVTDEVGRLVDNEDPEGITRAVLTLLAREDRTDTTRWRRKIADYARRNYAQDTVMRELVDLYEDCLTWR